MKFIKDLIRSSSTDNHFSVLLGAVTVFILYVPNPLFYIISWTIGTVIFSFIMMLLKEVVRKQDEKKIGERR